MIKAFAALERWFKEYNIAPADVILSFRNERARDYAALTLNRELTDKVGMMPSVEQAREGEIYGLKFKLVHRNEMPWPPKIFGSENDDGT